MFFSKKIQSKEENWSLDKALLDALIISLDEGVIVYGADFKIITLNKAAEKILEVKAEQIVGQIFSLDKAKGFKSKIMAQIMFPSLAPTVARKSEPGEYPQILEISLDDPVREFHLVTSQVTDLLGRPWGFVKIVTDKTREASLLQSKSEFITMAAHQLRTPATGLDWALSNLAKEEGLSEESRTVVDIAGKTAHNLLQIINELLSAAQIEEGKFGYKLEKVDLVKFLEKVLLNAEIVAKEYKVKLYFEPPAVQEVFVNVDTARLGMAVSNLIDNAIKYNVPNGQVTVKVSSNKTEVEVSVKDTGMGIPDDDLPKLFAKFFRAKNVEDAAIGGSGLGLYLTKNIIKKHGGRIWAESVINRGSIFYFTLPLHAGTS